MQLRDYQISAIDRIATRRPIICAPTGSGKTVIACEIARRSVESGRRVLLVAHRRELISQGVDRMAAHGMQSGVIMAGEPETPLWPVQVASVQTLTSRSLPDYLGDDADLIIDECHRSISPSYASIIGAREWNRVIGLTATPYRMDGQGLGQVYDDIVEAATVRELLDAGHIMEPIVYGAPSPIDLSKVGRSMGDYAQGQLEEVMSSRRLVGDVVTEWRRHARGRPTIAYAVGVAHSLAITRAMTDAGVAAMHVDGTTPESERDRVSDLLSRGAIEVVVNCGVYTEGVDIPSLGCVILARPTQSLGLYRQMIGRITRTQPGKAQPIIIDHARCTERHGFIDEPITYSLNGRVKRKSEALPPMMTCPECWSIYRPQPACPICGHVQDPKVAEVRVEDGELVRLERGPARMPGMDARYAAIIRALNDSGRRVGAAAWEYHVRYHRWPSARMLTERAHYRPCGIDPHTMPGETWKAQCEAAHEAARRITA